MKKLIYSSDRSDRYQEQKLKTKELNRVRKQYTDNIIQSGLIPKMGNDFKRQVFEYLVDNGYDLMRYSFDDNSYVPATSNDYYITIYNKIIIKDDSMILRVPASGLVALACDLTGLDYLSNYGLSKLPSKVRDVMLSFLDILYSILEENGFEVLSTNPRSDSYGDYLIHITTSEYDRINGIV